MPYPDYMRINCLCGDYAEIAFNKYYKVKQRYLFYKKEQDFDIFNESTIKQNSIVSVVFAQMAIESFCNDYAAACLGDAEFYDNFDKLDCIGKLQLICKFILKVKLDKSREPYTSLKALIKKRNEYTHNKSFDFDIARLIPDTNCDDDIPDDILYKLRLKDCQDLLNESMIGIKAMIEIANFFDERDENSRAYFRFFAFMSRPIDIEEAIVKQELKALGLKNLVRITSI